MELSGDGASRAVISRLSSARLVRNLGYHTEKTVASLCGRHNSGPGGATRPAADTLKDPRRMSGGPALAARFPPSRSLLGRYEVCLDPGRLEDAAPSGWAV